MNKLIEHNENLDTWLYLPSDLESLKEKHEYFEIPDLETKIQRHNNSHHWLQDIAQIKHFQYRFFQNIILGDDTVPQIKILSYFLLKFFRFNYQLLWEQQDQNAYIHFPQVLTEIELLPYVINEANKHLHYRHHTSFNRSYRELINLDNQFLLENSEVSDNRTYTSTNITPETFCEKFDFSNLQQYSQQDTFYSDDNIEQFQNQEEQFPTLQNIQQDVNLTQYIPNHSEKAPKQKISQPSDITTKNPQSITITNDLNTLQIPIHNVTQITLPLQNPINTDSNGTSTISTLDNDITPQLQTQQPSPRNYDPLFLPPQ